MLYIGFFVSGYIVHSSMAHEWSGYRCVWTYSITKEAKSPRQLKKYIRLRKWDRKDGQIDK